MDNNNLVPNSRYFISYNNNTTLKYLGTYEKEILSQIEQKPTYVFKLVYKVLQENPLKVELFSRSMNFTIDKVTVKPYINTPTSSVLGKRQTQIDNESNKIAKSEMTFTEEEIRKDREYWEAVDGGSIRRINKRKKTNKRKKSKKARTRRVKKSRKYNK